MRRPAGRPGSRRAQRPTPGSRWGGGRLALQLENRLGELRLPTLIAWGREDAWLPVDHAERLKACIPHARMHVLEGAGHLVQEDAPSRLCGLLEDFLHPA
ncbi:alpha/beta fold hydrolase [Streptomyces sp. NPDC007100]|uniref:alpha/beta fold hydrolase n=1 Tax=Streptomyces sp. NPDC007100 TaxID=3155602 RepID=UPI0033C44992